jgi:hypothetical protein
VIPRFTFNLDAPDARAALLAAEEALGERRDEADLDQ